MSIIVQKFGGTSVADTQKILGAARKAIRSAQAGHQVVVVVSAMGKTTDRLINLAKEITERPSSRELDMLMSSGEQITIALLAIALESLGYKAVSMTGAQIGIKTDSSHTKARIKTIDTERMRKALNDGKIVIAAGFQGVDESGNITTLGRGGSDTSAVALAAALGAEECEIYTDVDGIYTTDPRLLPEARKVAQISYDEMLELASLGAGVMHSRSIEFAKKFAVNVHVRSSFSDTAGSLITALPEGSAPVAGVAVAKNEAQLTLVGVPDKPGNAMRIFSKIADAKIATDMIVQNVGVDGKTDVAFTVPGTDLTATLDVLQSLVSNIGAEKVEWKENAVKLSIVGLGMESQPGVAEKMFRALSEQNINIAMITTSGIKISALVDRDCTMAAIRAVHNAFSLQTPVTAAAGKKKTPQKAGGYHRRRETNVSAFVPLHSSYLGMEDILIESITLDKQQSRITLPDIPDKPGIAAEVFEKIAAAKIVVDMIVQSSSRDGRAIISFTVPRNVLDKALKVVRKLSADWKADEPLYNPAAAILSVHGTGLRSHTGLAYRMFRTLADGGINVNIISTSERCVSVTVDDKSGEKGLQLFDKEFANEKL
ncbi:MAG: aspartate kinase [Planctomycetaceae bacterium]|jgi:aspartate kinase|nr:aspartate kinase [Planctomycetaceae bacterium]